MIQDDFVDGRVFMFVSVHRCFFLQVNVFVCKPKLPHVAPASSFKVMMVGAKLQRQLAPTHKSTAIAPTKLCIQTCATAQLWAKTLPFRSNLSRQLCGPGT